VTDFHLVQAVAGQPDCGLELDHVVRALGQRGEQTSGTNKVGVDWVRGDLKLQVREVSSKRGTNREDGFLREVREKRKEEEEEEESARQLEELFLVPSPIPRLLEGSPLPSSPGPPLTHLLVPHPHINLADSSIIDLQVTNQALLLQPQSEPRCFASGTVVAQPPGRPGRGLGLEHAVGLAVGGVGGGGGGGLVEGAVEPV